MCLTPRSKLILGILAISLFYLLWPNPPADVREFAFKTPHGAHTLRLKVATTDIQQAKGLMFVGSMPEGEGMLFVHERPQISKFWMKNTYIPLDIIFIDESRKIIHIHENARPLDESIISYPGAVKYVVELNAGMCRKLELKVGHELVFSN